jgi:uncharacterized membrane protein
MAVAFSALFSWLSVQRHEAYQSHAFDLGNMDQAVWNTLHGHFLWFTDMAVGHRVLTSRLAIHVEPLLGLMAPLYVLHRGPETLLVAQAWVVGLGAIPAYLLARFALGRPWLALVFPAAYLLHPSLQNMLLDDFHAVALSSCFLLWALYFYFTDRMPGFAIFAVLAASTKEDVGLLVALLGVALLLRRRLYAAFMTVVCGIGWFLISVLLIIPAFNPAGVSPYLGRYSYLGHGLRGILLGSIRHPRVVWHVVTSAPRVTYLDALFHPAGLVPLLGLPILLLALPAFAINMLSSDSTMYSGFYQYSAELIPYVIAAAAVGTAAVTRAGQRWKTPAQRLLPAVLCILVLLAALVDTYRMGFSPLARGYLTPSPGPHQRLENSVLARIPGAAVVAAADEMVPHLAERRWVYMLPTTHPRNGPQAQYLALDATIPSTPVRPATLHAVALKALQRGYGVQQAKDGLLVLRKGASRKRIPPAFYSFIFSRAHAWTPLGVQWGPLRLRGFVVHPRILEVNPARPDIALETYWQTWHTLPPRAAIAFYLSPVYRGRHPAYSSRWRVERESPTWDWLPLTSWPLHRTVRAISLPLLPPRYKAGKVDVAVGVSGLGRPGGGRSGESVRGAPGLVRVAAVQVDT